MIYYEIIFRPDLNKDGERNFVTLRVFRRLMQLTELIMSGFIFYIAFRNYKDAKKE